VANKLSRRSRAKRGRDIARVTLGAIRTVNGAAALVAPRFVAKRTGVEGEAADPTLYPWRLFGVRTVVIGVHLIVAQGAQRRWALKVAIPIHASDTIAALMAALRDELPRKQAYTAVAISATNTVLAVLAQER
jgi:hypothetical protein